MKTKIKRSLISFSVLALFAIIFGNSQTQPAKAEVNDLFAHLKFDNDTLDSVGDNNFFLRGTTSFSNDVAPVTGSITSLYLDGGIESQALGGFELFNGWSGGTVSFWMKLDSATTQTWSNNSNHDLIFKYNILQTRVFKDATGQLKLMTSHSNGTSFGTWITSSASLPTDTWIHVATTHTGTTASIYFDGQFVNSGSTGKTLGSASTDTFEISTYDGGFSGYIDDFQVYNRAINQAEIAELASGTGTPPQTFTITSSASAGGTINPTGVTNIIEGNSQTFTISPNSGYQTSNVLVDGVSQGVVSSYTFSNVTANHTISAEFTLLPPTSHTITATAGTGGSISPLGSVVVTEGNSQTFTISPNSGYQTSNVLVDGVSQGVVSSYTFSNVTANHTISASFSVISDTTPPTGTILINNGATSTTQTAITLTLSATDNASGVSQMRFSNDGFNFSTPTAFALSAPWVLTNGNGTKTVYAQFLDGANNWSTLPITDTITLNITTSTNPQLGAHVLLAQNEFAGTNPAITPAINTQTTGSSLLAISMGWLSNLSTPIDNFSNTWTSMSGPNIYFSPEFYTALWAVPLAQGGNNHTVSFAKDAYPAGEISTAFIEVKNGGIVNSIYNLAPGSNQTPGNITVDGPATLVAIWSGDSAQLDHTAIPDNGFTIIDSYLDFGNNDETAVQVAIAVKEVTTPGTYTVNWTSNPVQNCGCYLIAVQNTTSTPIINHTITATANTGGAISPTGNVSIVDGSSQTFTVSPNSGYQTSNVLVDGVSQGVVSSYTFSNVTANHTISAEFTLLPPTSHTITATAGTGGSISPLGSVVVTEGNSQTFTISPNSGYQTSNVLVDGVSQGVVSSYTFSNVTANHTISAEFVVNTPTEGTFEIDNQFITGLQNPTAMAFAPDGRLFVTEQAGAVRIITPEGQLLPTPFLVTTNMRSDEERGLLGIAFDPDFVNNNYIYIFYTENSLGARLSRFTANGNTVVPNSELILLEYYNISGNHRGGDIHFGPDGKLYLSLGDAGEPLNSQLVTNYDGKILRLNSDGTIPNDNPTSFVNTSGQTLTPVGQYRAIWAFGLRNPYRFSFDSNTGKMHINDVGAGAWEEVNVGQAGINYGWPTCEGMCSNQYAQNPIYVHERGIEGCAITGGAFYTGNQFPATYTDNYFIIDYCSTWIRYLDTSNTFYTFPLSIPQFSVDLKTGPDGSLYVAGHGSGIISKITFVGSGSNQNPVAQANVSPISGEVPLNVNFDGSTSTDPDGDQLTYTWDFGDGITSNSVITTHTYTIGGSYNGSLTVDDGQGGSDIVNFTIMAGSTPIADITLPDGGTFYTAGDTINFSGVATDPDDGVLPASAYSWTVLFHHDQHTHPHLGPINGITNGSFDIPTFGHTEDNVFYRIYLTVTDSSGLQTTVTRDVMPIKANITIDSNIPGTEILLDGQPQTTPYTFVGVAGVQRTIGVTSPQTISGQGYQFDTWSDGGSESHMIITPNTNTTYTVNMVEQTIPSVPPPTIYWKFDNNVTESINNITTVGRGSIRYSTDVAPINNPNSASLTFNGATGTYLATNGSQIINGWTEGSTSVWVKITDTVANSWSTGSYHALLFKYGILQTRILKDSTGLKFVASHSNGSPFGNHIVSTTSIPTNTWVNLVTVHQGTNLNLYINGQLAGSGNTTNSLGGSSTDGLDIIGHGGNYSGLLDDLRLYNIALSPSQVQQLPLQ